MQYQIVRTKQTVHPVVSNSDTIVDSSDCLSQLCPTCGPHVAQSKVLCGLVEVSTVLKVLHTQTICPYFDNLEFDIFDAVGPQCHFIEFVTIAVTIWTFSIS